MGYKFFFFLSIIILYRYKNGLIFVIKTPLTPEGELLRKFEKTPLTPEGELLRNAVFHYVIQDFDLIEFNFLKNSKILLFFK